MCSAREGVREDQSGAQLRDGRLAGGREEEEERSGRDGGGRGRDRSRSGGKAGGEQPTDRVGGRAEVRLRLEEHDSDQLQRDQPEGGEAERQEAAAAAVPAELSQPAGRVRVRAGVARCIGVVPVLAVAGVGGGWRKGGEGEARRSIRIDVASASAAVVGFGRGLRGTCRRLPQSLAAGRPRPLLLSAAAAGANGARWRARRSGEGRPLGRRVEMRSEHTPRTHPF
jgi:hypothetical protein